MLSKNCLSQKIILKNIFYLAICLNLVKIKFYQSLSKIINKADIDKVFVYGDKILNTYKKIKIEKEAIFFKTKVILMKFFPT